MKIRIVAALSLLSVAGIARTASASGDLSADGYLFAGQSIIGSECYVHLDMQSDGNLVLYYGYGTGAYAAWASNTVGRGAYAAVQSDGNFVVYDWSNNPVWAANPKIYGPYSYVEVQDDGNLVLYDEYGTPAWASSTFVGQPLGQTCSHDESSTYMTENTNRAGGDYESILIGRNWPEACAYWCSQDSRCVAFTHVPMGVQGQDAVCWLKSSLTGASRAIGMTSGVVDRYLP